DELIAHTLLPRLENQTLNELLDASVVPSTAGRMALTIDSYVVRPLSFPGGDIGRLAVSGTVNDLAVCGAEPLGLALSLILAEGLERSTLEAMLDSIHSAADEAGVPVITGDTKVVGRGQADGMYITTAGVGSVPVNRRLHPDQIRPGDLILVSGPIADHGLAVMLAREMPEVQSVIRSDVAPLNRMIRSLLERVNDGVVFMRDPTRGGLACVVTDIAVRSGLHVVLEENSIPIRPETRHAADMLGLDPLEVANEGKVVIVVRPEAAETALAALKNDPYGQSASIIGHIDSTPDSICELQTIIGGRRILQKPYGEQLPRIC
ncbi:MAG TPA: hydrogenase expression/formation protein HypE, partial [Tepidisphaeraceae bacterium]|nr:hydrogenase expression/formation protein HypE [Tepidisphaeraceae bacterium]